MVRPCARKPPEGAQSGFAPQDDKTAVFRIHLDKAALEKALCLLELPEATHSPGAALLEACEVTCLADLFGVDVMEQCPTVPLSN